MKALTFALLGFLLATPYVAAQEEEPEPTPVVSGPARLDLNTRAGDQNQRTTFSTPEFGSTITVDVAVSEGGDRRTGFDLHLTYDPDVMAYQTAEAVDLFEGAQLVPSFDTGAITVAGLLLGNQTSQTSGSLAQITFSVLGDVSEGSTIALDQLLLGSAFTIDSLQIGTQTAIVTIGGSSNPVTLEKPDFDGDGLVGFTDFIIFAGGFGATSGEQSYNPILDLDGDGSVGFSDFLAFAQAFGT